jgi:hypothetical protein
MKLSKLDLEEARQNLRKWARKQIIDRMMSSRSACETHLFYQDRALKRWKRAEYRLKKANKRIKELETQVKEQNELLHYGNDLLKAGLSQAIRGAFE